MSALVQLGTWGFLALIGAILAAAGWSGMSARRRLRETGVTVVGSLTARAADSDGDSYVTIRYKVADAEFDLTAYFVSGKIGDAIELLVDPTEPRRAVVARPSAGAMSLAAYLCGLLLFAVALLGTVSSAGKVFG